MIPNPNDIGKIADQIDDNPERIPPHIPWRKFVDRNYHGIMLVSMLLELLLLAFLVGLEIIK